MLAKMRDFIIIKYISKRRCFMENFTLFQKILSRGELRSKLVKISRKNKEIPFSGKRLAVGCQRTYFSLIYQGGKR